MTRELILTQMAMNAIKESELIITFNRAYIQSILFSVSQKAVILP